MVPKIRLPPISQDRSHTNQSTERKAHDPSSSGFSLQLTDEVVEAANILMAMLVGPSWRPRTATKDNSTGVEVEYEDGGGKRACNICRKKFESFQALGGHMAAHNNQERNRLSTSVADGGVQETPETKLHRCRLCGVEFPDGRQLGGHMRKHKAEMEVVTPVAVREEKEEKEKKAVTEFAAVVDLSEEPNLPHLEQFRCPECPMKFHTNKSLYGHMRVHSARTYRGMIPPGAHVRPRGSLSDVGKNPGRPWKRRKTDGAVEKEGLQEEREEEEEGDVVEVLSVDGTVEAAEAADIAAGVMASEIEEVQQVENVAPNVVCSFDLNLEPDADQHG